LDNNDVDDTNPPGFDKRQASSPTVGYKSLHSPTQRRYADGIISSVTAIICNDPKPGNTSGSSRTDRLQSIQALRAVAALMVVVHHVTKEAVERVDYLPAFLTTSCILLVFR
jgi:hypothetical protein